MKNTGNKRQLCDLLCTFKLDEYTVKMDKDESIVRHDEADVTLISYLLDAAKRGSQIIRVLSDDTDVFVLLAHYQYYLLVTQIKVQMAKSDGTVLDINAAVSNLGDNLIIGMHCLSG